MVKIVLNDKNNAEIKISNIQFINILCRGVYIRFSFTKLKNIEKVRVEFLDSTNIAYGVDPYKLTELDFRAGFDITDRPPPLFSNVKELPTPNGGWDNRKGVFFVQEVPVPCVIASIDIEGEVSDDI